MKEFIIMAWLCARFMLIFYIVWCGRYLGASRVKEESHMGARWVSEHLLTVRSMGLPVCHSDLGFKVEKARLVG